MPPPGILTGRGKGCCGCHVVFVNATYGLSLTMQSGESVFDVKEGGRCLQVGTVALQEKRYNEALI